MKGRFLRRIARPLALVAPLVLAACATDAPQDALDCAGPVCQRADDLFRPVFWIAVAIFVIVEGAIVFAAIKFRDRPGREEPRQVHGNTKLEFAWTLIPALLMAGVAVPTVYTIIDSAPALDSGDLEVTVVAKQWWWEYEYLNAGDIPFFTANELVIPTGRSVFLNLTSDDVIHSFWIPRLAGKQDVVPGRTNTLELEASEPGFFEGQCAEFCGISHANMRLRVRAVDPATFDAWVNDQIQPAQVPSDPNARAGMDLFFGEPVGATNACIQCHAIRGTEALARVGPDLTHFASRTWYAGTYLRLLDDDLTLTDGAQDQLHAWIKNTRALKPGVRMPPFEDLGLTDDQIDLLVAYLLSLK